MPRGALRGLFAWRVDPEPSARVPLTASPEAMLREPAIQREGRPGEAMAAMYCGRCARPNPERARYCSNCGAPLIRNTNTGSFSAIPSERGNETTSIISDTGDPESYDEASADYPAADTLPPDTALLIVLRGPNAGSRFLLDHDFTSTGRHPDSDIFLDDVTVSRRHAEFDRQGFRLTVHDVGSLNGTYVNRERIEEAELTGGDEVQIGKFRLLFLTSQNLDPRTSSADPRGRGAQDYA